MDPYVLSKCSSTLLHWDRCVSRKIKMERKYVKEGIGKKGDNLTSYSQAFQALLRSLQQFQSSGGWLMADWLWTVFSLSHRRRGTLVLVALIISPNRSESRPVSSYGELVWSVHVKIKKRDMFSRNNYDASHWYFPSHCSFRLQNSIYQVVLSSKNPNDNPCSQACWLWLEIKRIYNENIISRYQT